MTDQATATVDPAPTAIEFNRVLILNEDEQRLLLAALGWVSHDNSVAALHLEALRSRLAYGDEYINAKDELTRTTLRKRRLEAEVRRCNQAIERCEGLVVDEFLQNGEAGSKHAATGASLVLDRKVYAKLDIDVDDLPDDEAKVARAEAKARAGEGLIAAGLETYVRPDFNLNSVSAYFREQIKAYDAEQRELPEHQRVPRPASSFLPDELKGLLVLNDKPSISVRA